MNNNNMAALPPGVMREKGRTAAPASAPVPAPAPYVLKPLVGRPATLTMPMVSGLGDRATDNDGATPENLTSITFDQVRDLVDRPQQGLEKSHAQWLIPSTLMARKLYRQQAEGQYVALWGDLDEPTTTIVQTAEIIRSIVGGCDFEVYATRSATRDVQKCRILIPLHEPLTPAEWALCAEVFNRKMAAAGLVPDRKSEVLSQIMYLPNKGEFYDCSVARGGELFKPLVVWAGDIAAREAEIARQREVEQSKREAAKRRKEELARQRGQTHQDPIDAFNDNYDPSEFMLNRGYEQRGDKYRHPASQTGNFSASIVVGRDGKRRVHSLSSADPLYTGGGGVGAHDAFSTYCILEHGGNTKKHRDAALKAACDKLLFIDGKPWNEVKRQEWAEQKRQERQRQQLGSAGFDIPLPDVADTPANGLQGQQDRDISDDVPPEFSEMAMASRFAELCGNQFRWTPGMDWMFNAGTHWERDDHLKRFNVVKAVCRDAANVAESINKASLASKLCSANTSSAVLSLARSESGIVTPVTDWNRGEMLFNTPGGVYNLETGREVSREGHLFTQVSGIAPDARMPIPIWERFIVDIFGADLAMVEFVQRMAGYCLTGSTREQKLFFLYGAGANGKSVFIDALKDIAGKYGHNLPAEALMTSKHERHPTTLAALQGKRLAISSEIEESSHWTESRIKSLTGDATLTARFMRGDEFTFDITHKHILAGNFRPRLKGDDYAMQRRMVLIPFEQQFKGARCDINLPQKLKAEYPGILAWCIAGAAKWAESGLQIPTTVQESSREYMAEQNDIDLWIEECCNVGDGLRCKSSDLYTSYAAWKQRNGEVAGSSKVFSQRLERHFTKSKAMAGMMFARIELKPGEQQVAYLSR